MTKAKTPIMFLLIFIVTFTAMTALSGCIDDDSAAPSIYNSTENNSPSRRNSTDDNSTDNNSADFWTDKPINGRTEELVAIEYKIVPINAAYSKDILGDINVSDGVLEQYSRIQLELEEKNVDIVAEDINFMYIDDDLRVIENYWVFATRQESKESRMEKIKNSKRTNPSSDEMIEFMEQFDKKYPVKYVRTGIVLFITVENKDVLLSEISEEDIQMLRALKDTILEKNTDQK